MAELRLASSELPCCHEDVSAQFCCVSMLSELTTWLRSMQCYFGLFDM